MVPLTFVDRSLCGKDGHCEGWVELATMGRSVVYRERRAGKRTEASRSPIGEGFAHKTSQAVPTGQSSRPEARTAATKGEGDGVMRQGPGTGLDGLIRSGDGVPELYFCQVVEALLWRIPSGRSCSGGLARQKDGSCE